MRYKLLGLLIIFISLFILPSTVHGTHRASQFDICVTIVDGNNNLITGSEIPGIEFSITINPDSKTPKTYSLTTPLDYNIGAAKDNKGNNITYVTDRFTDIPGNDVQCQVFKGIGDNQPKSYNYSTESISNDFGFLTPKYYDSTVGEGQTDLVTIAEFEEYGTSSTSDGILAGDKNKHGQILILNQYIPPPGPFSFTVSSTPICSDGKPYVDIDWSPGSANAAYYHVNRSDGVNTETFIVNAPATLYHDTNVVAGQVYTYNVIAYNQSLTSYDAGWSSPVTVADCDTTPPITPTIDVGAQVGNACYSTGSLPDPWPGSFNVEASDPESGIASVTYKLQENPLSPGNCYNGSSFSILCSDPAANILISDSTSPYTVSFPITELSAGNQYSISATATNTSNLSSTSLTYYFNISNSCAKPSLETSGGDVHSNEDINVP